MRNLLALIGLAVVLFLGIGWYSSWYTARIQTGTDGKLNVSVDVDQKKVGRDVGSFTEKAGKFISTATKAEPAPADPAKVAPPAPSGLKTPATGR